MNQYMLDFETLLKFNCDQYLKNNLIDNAMSCLRYQHIRLFESQVRKAVFQMIEIQKINARKRKNKNNKLDSIQFITMQRKQTKNKKQKEQTTTEEIVFFVRKVEENAQAIA